MPFPPLEAVCDYRRWLLQTLYSPLLVTLVEFREFSLNLISTSLLICTPQFQLSLPGFSFPTLQLDSFLFPTPITSSLSRCLFHLYPLLGWESAPSLNADIPSGWNLDMLLQFLRVHMYTSTVVSGRHCFFKDTHHLCQLKAFIFFFQADSSALKGLLKLLSFHQCVFLAFY